jgi:hypothetical protein
MERKPIVLYVSPLGPLFAPFLKCFGSIIIAFEEYFYWIMGNALIHKKWCISNFVKLLQDKGIAMCYVALRKKHRAPQHLNPRTFILLGSSPRQGLFNHNTLPNL